jgi:hypothetical protein
MKIFTIENETNNIPLHATVQDAEAVVNAETFRSQFGLNKLAADWPAARLVEIWNSLPGVKPGQEVQGSPDGSQPNPESDSELGPGGPRGRSSRRTAVRCRGRSDSGNQPNDWGGCRNS